MTEPDPNAAAAWMADQVNTHRELYQTDAADHIYREFGGQLTYENDNGNLAIDKSVLAAFRKLTESTVVWERGARVWRLRERHDPEGRSAY